MNYHGQLMFDGARKLRRLPEIKPTLLITRAAVHFDSTSEGEGKGLNDA